MWGCEAGPRNSKSARGVGGSEDEVPNVNLIELEGCLQTLIPYLEKNHRKPYAAESVGKARAALAMFHRALETTDQSYHGWRVELAEGRQAYKAMHRRYTRLQKQLEDEGAIGYPEQAVEYFLEEDNTLAACREMRDFLALHRQQLDFADKEIEALDGLLADAVREGREAGAALNDYRGVANSRKAAMERAIQVIAAIRPVVRKDLGIAHPDYVGIKWPAMVAPDAM
jgi:hypothetical protein